MRKHKKAITTIRAVCLSAVLITSLSITALAASTGSGKVSIKFVYPPDPPPNGGTSTPGGGGTGGGTGGGGSGGGSPTVTYPGGTGGTTSTDRSGGTGTSDSAVTRAAAAARSTTTIDEGDVPLGSVSILDPSVPLSSLPALPKTGSNILIQGILALAGAVLIRIATKKNESRAE